MSDEFGNLDVPGRATAFAASHSRAIVLASVATAVVLSWLVLIVMGLRAAATVPPVLQGPGGTLLDALPMFQVPAWLDAFARTCLAPAPVATFGGATLAAFTAMWFLMAVATMLPSAAPMVLTYCEIADTARARHKRVVHPLVLVAGYLSVWLAASLAFAMLMAGLQVAGATGGGAEPVRGYVATAALAIAGLYQFSHLKHACLEHCRNPFAILFARWSDRPAAILRLGAEQGLWCLGCCWALMLVMFAVGTMNLFWMALIALFAIVEKGSRGGTASWIAGGFLLVWAAALLLVE